MTGKPKLCLLEGEEGGEGGERGEREERGERGRREGREGGERGERERAMVHMQLLHASCITLPSPSS